MCVFAASSVVGCADAVAACVAVYNPVTAEDVTLITAQVVGF
jgi:hypothetical protein